MSEFQLQNGMKLYYKSHGIGDNTIIMMHGWASTHSVFEDSVPLLRRKARVIVYDHRGHGGSKHANLEPVTLRTLASDLRELITGLKLRNITLFGWSMGAATAMAYVRDFGCDALRQLVLCDMTPRLLNDKNWKLGLFQGRFTQADIRRTAGQDVSEFFEEFVTEAKPILGSIPHFVMKPVLRQYLSEYDSDLLNMLSDDMKQADFRAVIGKITVPLTYIYPEPGSLFSPALARWYRAQVNCPFRSVCITKSTHMLVNEHPALLAEALMKVL